MQLKQRIITAAIAIPVVVLTTWYANTLVFAALLTAFIGLGAWEWAALSGLPGTAAKLSYALVVVALLIVCFLLRNTVVSALITIAAVVWWVALTIVLVVQQKRSRLSLGHRFMRSVAGIAILVPSWLSLLLIHDSRYFGAGYVIYLFALIWLADSAAYFAGHLWGKAKLASVISPGKTWAGFAGAIVAGACSGAVFALATDMQVPDIIIFSIVSLITVAGSVVGDLTESLIKRVANTKDSGRIFPGHGGVLDRIDSLTAAAPLFLAGLWLACISHHLPTACADPSAVTSRTPSAHFNVVSATPSVFFSPCVSSQRRLSALATAGGEKCRLARTLDELL